MTPVRKISRFGVQTTDLKNWELKCLNWALHQFMFALIVQFKAFAETHDTNRRLQKHSASCNIFFKGPSQR